MELEYYWHILIILSLNLSVKNMRINNCCSSNIFILRVQYPNYFHKIIKLIKITIIAITSAPTAYLLSLALPKADNVSFLEGLCITNMQ